MLDVVIETVIGNFLPDRTKAELIADALYQVQASNESFHDFVSSVHKAMGVLLSTVLEGDAVEIILSGLIAS